MDRSAKAMQEVAKQVKAMCARTEQITEKATKHLIPAPKFDGHGDVNLFISRYNETALINGWEGEEKLLRFKMSISGPAAVGVEGKTFEEICTQLVKRYTLTEAGAHQLLRTLKWKAGDSIYEFSDYTHKIIQAAFPELTREQQEQRVIKEIISALPTNYQVLQWQLTHNNPKKLQEVIAMIQDFGALNPHTIKVNQIDPEVSELKTAMQAMTKTQEELAKAVAAISTTVAALSTTVHQGPARRPKSELTCYGCGKQGHIRRECPNKKTTGNDSVQLA